MKTGTTRFMGTSRSKEMVYQTRTQTLQIKGSKCNKKVNWTHWRQGGIPSPQINNINTIIIRHINKGSNGAHQCNKIPPPKAPFSTINHAKIKSLYELNEIFKTSTPSTDNSSLRVEKSHTKYLREKIPSLHHNPTRNKPNTVQALAFN